MATCLRRWSPLSYRLLSFSPTTCQCVQGSKSIRESKQALSSKVTVAKQLSMLVCLFTCAIIVTALMFYHYRYPDPRQMHNPSYICNNSTSGTLPGPRQIFPKHMDPLIRPALEKGTLHYLHRSARQSSSLPTSSIAQPRDLLTVNAPHGAANFFLVRSFLPCTASILPPAAGQPLGVTRA